MSFEIFGMMSISSTSIRELALDAVQTVAHHSQMDIGPSQTSCEDGMVHGCYFQLARREKLFSILCCTLRSVFFALSTLSSICSRPNSKNCQKRHRFLFSPFSLFLLQPFPVLPAFPGMDVRCLGYCSLSSIFVFALMKSLFLFSFYSFLFLFSLFVCSSQFVLLGVPPTRLRK